MSDSLSRLVEAVRSAGVDIAPGYCEYVRLAFAIANDCGEAGREGFIALCSLSVKFNREKAERLFSNALKKGDHRIHLGTAFHLAELAGVRLEPPSRPRDTHASNASNANNAAPVSHTRARDNNVEIEIEEQVDPFTHLPFFPEGHEWPRMLRQIMAFGQSREQRDVLLLGGLTTLGASLAQTLRFLYGGKWFTPSIGARVGYAGLQAKGWTSAGTLYAKSADGGLFREKFGVMYLHADAMWNFSNAVSGYKESRTWNFVPFVGVGWARSYGNDAHDNEIGFDAGLLNVVRLCSSLDLTLEARCLLVNQRFDGVTGGRTGEGMLSVTAGLAYKFNRRGFVRASNVQPVDVTPYLDRIRNLEENNTDLASKNSVLNDENEKLRNAPAKVVVEQKVSASPVVLFFRIGKATLDSKELTNLEFYVRNAMKLDSDKTFTLIGSADKDTGNRELNQRLSEQRMEYVYDLLKNKYGVAPERLVRKAEGDTNNRFAEPELNRAVIVE